MSPPATLAVAALEFPSRFGDVAGALATVAALLGPLAGVDLALLPELCLTGYVSPAGDFDLRAFAEPLDGPTAAALAALAARHGVALAGPLVERAGAHAYNSLLLFDRHGQRVGHWRKRHPWHPERWAAPGDLGTPVVTLGGARITACTCFDLHFIAADAPDALRAADVLLFPSAWVQLPPDSRAPALADLARTFGVAVVNANWGRSRPGYHGQGDSAVYSPGGDVLARAPAALRQPRAVLATVPLRARP